MSISTHLQLHKSHLSTFHKITNNIINLCFIIPIINSFFSDNYCIYLIIISNTYMHHFFDLFNKPLKYITLQTFFFLLIDKNNVLTYLNKLISLLFGREIIVYQLEVIHSKFIKLSLISYIYIITYALLTFPDCQNLKKTYLTCYRCIMICLSYRLQLFVICVSIFFLSISLWH